MAFNPDPLQELGKVLVETNYMTNLVGKVSLIGGGVGALHFFKLRNNTTPPYLNPIKTYVRNMI